MVFAYKADHAFAGLENGNRLIKMVLEKRSIPYSLRIGGEWCRVIHNDQQPVCSECKELRHTRKRCPEIICRICKEKGHMSYNCDRRNNRDEVEQQMADQNETSTKILQLVEDFFDFIILDISQLTLR